MEEEKIQVDSATLAEKLLNMVLSAPPEEDGAFKRRFDEFVLLRAFAVDYALALMSAKQAIFDSVRDHYATCTNRIADSKPQFTQDKVSKHLKKYSEAVTLLTPELGFWEVGRQFSRFLSTKEPWVPDALEIAVGSGYFARRLEAVTEFLEKCDVRDRESTN